MAAFEPGETKQMAGDVTTLNWIVPGFNDRTEGNLGYETGRLAAGYWIAVLKQEIGADEFRFAGTTLRSGGREGLPAMTPAEDKARVHVSDRMIKTHGADHVRAMRADHASRVPLSGPDRLAKVLPVIRHDADLPPAVQYPMGGGGLQWTLKQKCAFLIAAFVDPASTVVTPDFTVNARASYDGRARLRRYLCVA